MTPMTLFETKGIVIGRDGVDSVDSVGTLSYYLSDENVDEVTFEIQIIAGECAALRDAGAYQNDFE